MGAGHGTTYNVGLNAGTGIGATVAARKMSSGASTLVYTLYSNSTRTTVWGNTVGTDTVSCAGTGIVQNYTVYGRAPAQAATRLSLQTQSEVAISSNKSSESREN